MFLFCFVQVRKLRVKFVVIDLKPPAGAKIQKPSLFVFKAPALPVRNSVSLLIPKQCYRPFTKIFLISHLVHWFTSELHILHEQCYNNNNNKGMLLNKKTHHIKVNIATIFIFPCSLCYLDHRHKINYKF